MGNATREDEASPSYHIRPCLALNSCTPAMGIRFSWLFAHNGGR